MEDLISTVMVRVKEIIAEWDQLNEPFQFQVQRNPQLHRLFQVIYQFCRVRGYKAVVKFFPHEVSDLEPALSLLQSQDRSQYG